MLDNIFARSSNAQALAIFQQNGNIYIVFFIFHRPSSGDCPVYPTDMLPFADRSDIDHQISTAASDSSPWSTIQQEVNKQKDLSAVNELPPKEPPYPWGSSPPSRVSPADDISTQMLGSRSRPASYGRSSSWMESNQNVAGNTVQMYPELSSTAPSKASWPTSAWESRTPSSSKYYKDSCT